MPPVISYAFTPISGYAYLGHDRLREIVRSAGASVEFRPFDIGQVFAATGTVPPAKQSPARLAYRQADMTRWARRLGLRFNATPKWWPVDATLASRTIIASELMGESPWAVTAAILAGVWADESNIADGAQLATLLQNAGIAAAALIDAASCDEVSARYASNTAWAIETGVFGSPTYVLGHDLFWGQDRLDFLAEALGREQSKPVSPVAAATGGAMDPLT